MGRIVAVIDVPKETFMPNTSTKTSILIFQKLPVNKIPQNYEIFMAIATTCGHDRRGKNTPDDDISEITNDFKKWALATNFNFGDYK